MSESAYGPEHRSLPVTFWVDPKDVKLTLNNIEFMDDDRVYLSVNNLFEVRIVRTDEGIVIDVFPSDDSVQFDEPVATTYAYDNEVTSIPE
jgi:hypothetical protein